MTARQRGVGLMGLIAGLFMVIVLALFAMKLIPHYIEFYTAKSAIEAIARDKQAASPAEVRRAFESRTAIDNITSVKPSDLEVTRDGNQVVIAFAYRKEVPLAGNVGLVIDFAADSRGQ
jgi:hypothetical protein